MVEIIGEYSYTVITVTLVYYFLQKSLQDKSTTKKNIKNWILFGIIFNLYSLSWLYTVYPLPWMKEGFLQLIGIAMVHSIISIASGFCFVIVAFANNKKIPQNAKPFAFAFTLSLAEVLRSLVLSILYYGSNSRIGLNWTAGTIGNALSTTPLIEYAYFGGTYMLTFILGYCVYSVISKKHFSLYKNHIVVIIVILFGIHFLVPINGPKDITKIATITTNFQDPKNSTQQEISSFYKEQAKIVHNMTLSLATSSVDIIVYPEDTRYISSLSTSTENDITKNFKNTLFVDGGTRKIQGGLSNYTIFYKPGWKKIPIRGKSFLMPFNEYVPVAFGPLLQFFIQKEDIGEYSTEHTYIPEHSSTVLRYGDLRVGTLICSEILSYATIASIKNEHPDIIFYQSHLNVFHDNPWFLMHMRSFTKVAAAQLRTPILTASNDSPSFYISPYGSILDTIPTGFVSKIYTVQK
jgi:apolipoprotein N-acyltransferase